MTKKQTWEAVQLALSENKASKKLSSALEDLLAPKSSGGSINPPQEIDGVMNYWCRFHEQYELVENMVMSGGKSKGYCRAGISKWNKNQAASKKLDAKALDAMTNGDMENAQTFAKESKELKASLKYDIEAD